MRMRCERSFADQLTLSASGVAGLLFVGVSTFEGLTRPGFDLRRHAVSALSLGERGWVMVATFIASGLLTLLTAAALRKLLADGPGRRWLPILVGLYGVGLVLAGIFKAPAGMGFPPGTPDDQMPVMTAAAIVHSMAFMLAFTSLTIACFVAARRLSGVGRTMSLFAGIAMPLLIVLGMAARVPPGIAFFIAAILGWAWLAAVVMALAGAAEQPPPQSLALEA